MQKLDYVDSLRGIAVLGVIMVHTNIYGNSNVPEIILKIIGSGAKGVQLFYLASALTLFISFKNRSAIEKYPIRNFALRRFFRIAPMYYLGIIYYIFQDGLGPRYWLGNETHITSFNILSNWTFLHGFNPYWINSLVPGGWSIGVEMTFYAILPFLFSKIKRLNQAVNLFIFSLLVNFCLRVLFLNFHIINDNRLWNEYLFLYFPCQLPIFCLGIILYFVVIEKESVRNISGKSIMLFSFLLITSLMTGIESLVPQHIYFGIGFLLMGYALSIFRFILIVNPITIYIGKISFSMYLVHFAILHWLNQINFVNYFENGILNYSARYLLVATLSTVISSIFYRLIEIPFQEIGKSMINKLEFNSKLFKINYE